MGFIELIAPLIIKHAPKYGISPTACSAIIGQAVLESGNGTSELAVNANNFFGLKYRGDRCKTAIGVYYKIGSEQRLDGSYVSSAMEWYKFPDMESGVIGYFDFTNISNYSNLKGVSDPRKYLENIKADGYATSINYVDKVMNVIATYGLTKYDHPSAPEPVNPSVPKMTINVHAGHNPDGKIACGAVGLIKESTEVRKVKDMVISYLKEQGHTVYDCTVDNGTSQSDVLNKIIAKCNSHKVDLDVSIHFNSGAGDKAGNGVTTGTEVWIYSGTSKSQPYAKRTVDAIAATGYKNRGVKISTGLYFLKHTSAPAMLVECCFVDDADDVKNYNADKMAKAIVKGITGVEPTKVEPKPEQHPCPYAVRCGSCGEWKCSM